MTTMRPAPTHPPSAHDLAPLGIGSLPLDELPSIGAPAVDRTHPRVRAAAHDEASLAAAVIAGSVVDPEIPVLTIADLGVLRRVHVTGERNQAKVEVTITPTYSGCPAVAAIAADIVSALARAGYPQASVVTALSPAWTTDELTPAAREALRRFGIAPPTGTALRPDGRVTSLRLSVRCPHCGSGRTTELSRFGSTACKSMWRCEACLEPFDHFKPL